jgi:hypothetical protein
MLGRKNGIVLKRFYYTIIEEKLLLFLIKEVIG